MKQLLILLLYSFQVQAELPTGNAKVLEYAKLQEGKKVGHGLCYEFVEGALFSFNKNWQSEYPTYKTGLFSGSYKGYGRVLKSKEEIIPGDIILFLGDNNKSHVGIVKSVLGEGFEVIDQNSMERVDKKSCVGAWIYKKGDLGWKKTIIFRPF